MPARYWTCRKCGGRNERAWLKCRQGYLRSGENCTGRRPPKHVPKHAIVMRDNGYQHFRDVNEAIHGAGDNCGVCLAVPKDSRNMQREHDHVTGLARGLACWRCNRLMPKQFDLQTARAIVAYLERVEAFYAVQETSDHRQQVLVAGPNRAVDDRTTTPEVFVPLDDRFGFTVDVAASDRNHRLPRYFTVDQDGLAQTWAGERVWCNPPYSDIAPWVEKAWLEPAALIVMLLPANRTEQPWWQEMVEPFRDRPGSRLTVEFLRGRLRFIAHDRDEVGPNERPPFGCCLLVFA